MKTTIEVNLPEDFVTVAELFNISLTRTLETLIDNITVYDFLAAETNTSQSQASRIFGKYLNTRNLDVSLGMTNKDDPSYHVPYIQSVMALIKESVGSKSTNYKSVINRWYEEIYLKAKNNEKKR